jgi:hypothetical protein
LYRQLLAYGVAFWILMGRSLLIRDRELVSSCVFLGWVDDSLLVWKLRSVFLRMGLEVHFYQVILFWYFHRRSAYIRRLCIVAPFLPVSIRLVRRLGFINNIFAVQKKDVSARNCKSNFIEKVMFLIAVARPRYDSGDNKTFYGKLGVFPFVTKEQARRTNVNRIVGTLEIKPINSINRDLVEFNKRLLKFSITSHIKSRNI